MYVLSQPVAESSCGFANVSQKRCLTDGLATHDRRRSFFTVGTRRAKRGHPLLFKESLRQSQYYALYVRKIIIKHESHGFILYLP